MPKQRPSYSGKTGAKTTLPVNLSTQHRLFLNRADRMPTMINGKGMDRMPTKMDGSPAAQAAAFGHIAHRIKIERASATA